MDHHQFDGPLLKRATSAILKTRDGKLRAAVPVSPMGECVFLNDVSHDEMCQALQVHKRLMHKFPRRGEGLDAYVDPSDTGYTIQGATVEKGLLDAAKSGNHASTKRENKTARTFSDHVQKDIQDLAHGMDGRIPVAVANGSGNA